MQDSLLRHIAEIHTVHGNLAFQLCIGQCAVVMRVFPSPYSGVFGALREIAAAIFPRIHQRHIALIGLRLLIHKGEDPGSTSQSGDNGVELVGDLRDGVDKISGQGQEGCNRAKCHYIGSRQA